MAKQHYRNLVVVLGDQLNHDSAAFDHFDPAQDVVWMAEAAEESEHVWSHKARIALFLSAMRHFRDELEQRGYTVLYRTLESSGDASLAEALGETAIGVAFDRILAVHPGEWRVKQLLEDAAARLGAEIQWLPDRHFLCSPEEFAQHADGRKQLRMEYFYREMRRKHDVLMEGGKPIGGEWNFDKQNRKPLSTAGPKPASPASFPPDRVTRDVLELVARRFAEHPGDLDQFDWPVTRRQALGALDDFVDHRLAGFGDIQDAMAAGEPFLNHSLLSAALNLKLLDPREVIQAAVDAYHHGDAPLNSVEGFVRQILGWREYVRGVYWLHMPGYVDRNALEADLPLPDFYWTGQTDYECLRQSIGQTLELGYAHHIQRLMVTGLYCLLLGVDPREVHKWYLAVYVDAVEWVELPNTLGMSQYADSGVMGSKPYAATGKYIKRMSNYCQSCRFNPDEATGPHACPFTTLYWDFLDRNHGRLAENGRMAFQLKSLERKSDAELEEIRGQANRLRGRVASGG